jgi:hypothetical protein
MTVGYGGTVIVKYKWNSYTGEPTLDITAYHGSDTNPANEDWYGSATVKDPNRAEGYYMDGGLLRLDLSKDAREIIEHETTSEGVEFQIIWKRRR